MLFFAREPPTTGKPPAGTGHHTGEILPREVISAIIYLEALKPHTEHSITFWSLQSEMAFRCGDGNHVVILCTHFQIPGIILLLLYSTYTKYYFLDLNL